MKATPIGRRLRPAGPGRHRRPYPICSRSESDPYAVGVDQRLSGKVALVTGGMSGLGEACVQRFGAEGATVVTLDQGNGGDHVVAVRDEGAVTRAVDAVVAEHARL